MDFAAASLPSALWLPPDFVCRGPEASSTGRRGVNIVHPGHMTQAHANAFGSSQQVAAHPGNAWRKLACKDEAVYALLQAGDVHDLQKVAFHRAQQGRVAHVPVLGVLALQKGRPLMLRPPVNGASHAATLAGDPTAGEEQVPRAAAVHHAWTAGYLVVLLLQEYA